MINRGIANIEVNPERNQDDGLLPRQTRQIASGRLHALRKTDQVDNSAIRFLGAFFPWQGTTRFSMHCLRPDHLF
jgi:hypothetical protein